MSDETLNNIEAASAVPESGSTAPPETADTGAPGDAEVPETKTFTQEELDAKIGERLAKERRKWEREMAKAAEQAPMPEVAPPRKEDYKSAEDYAEALSEYKYAQRVAEHEARKQQVEVVSTFEDREESARDKYADYDAIAKNDDLPVTTVMANAIVESEIGPDVLYWLGTNPREARRIAQLSPVSQVREIGKIEASLNNNTSPARKASSAPDPIRPVGSRASTPNYDPTDPRSVKTTSDSDWIRMRNQQLLKRAQG